MSALATLRSVQALATLAPVQALAALAPARALALAGLAAARVVPLALVAPYFGGRLVPLVVRVGLALALAVVVAPALVPVALPAATLAAPATLVALILKEALVGLALGFLTALVFHAVESAGRLIDTSRGANLAEVLVPGLERSSLTGALLVQLTIVVFLALDGHHVVIRAVAHSYDVLPVTHWPAPAGLGAAAALLMGAVGHLLTVALALAAPVLAAVFLADLALALVSRVSPQFDVFFLGLPLRAMLGTGVVLVTLIALMTVVRSELAVMLAQLGKLVAALTSG